MAVTVVDLAWASGIYEGEGSVGGRHNGHRGVRVSIAQKDRWILDKFVEIFGGAVYPHWREARSTAQENYWAWIAYGSVARGFLLSIFTWLSPRRRGQIRSAFAAERVDTFSRTRSRVMAWAPKKGITMKVVTVVFAALLLTGCASASDLVKALAKDNASACVSLKAVLYGDLTACRTNTPGSAVIEAGQGKVRIQHQGAR